MIDEDELAKYQAVGWQLRKENDTLRAELEEAVRVRGEATSELESARISLEMMSGLVEAKDREIAALRKELNQALDERQANFIMCGEIAAERESARALLKDIRDNAYPGHALAARITKELAK